MTGVKFLGLLLPNFQAYKICFQAYKKVSNKICQNALQNRPKNTVFFQYSGSIPKNLKSAYRETYQSRICSLAETLEKSAHM